MVQSITLQNVADTAIVNNDILGQICFAAPNESSGTDSILVSASIFARSEGTFAADNNATELVFLTGATESAAPGATNYDMTLSSAGNLTLAGDLTISGDDLTMATNTSGAALIADGTNFNPVVISGDIAIGTDGAAAIQANSVDGTMIALGSDTTGDIMYYNGTNYVRLAAAQDGYVLTATGAGAAPAWEAASGGGGSGTMTTVKSNTSAVGGADIVTLDFSSEFTVAESPDTEINISMAATQSAITSLGTLTGLILDGDKNITPGDGSMIHLDNSTLTDNNTTTSGTATKFTSVNFENPTVAASNASVTISDAATVYIANAPGEGTNMTFTRDWALWIDAGDLRYDGNIYAGTTLAMDNVGKVRVANQSYITGLGTITSGTWQSTNIAVSYGGTGASSHTAGAILLGNGTSAITNTGVLGAGYIIVGNGSGAPTLLAPGNSGDVLTSDGVGGVSWSAGGGMP